MAISWPWKRRGVGMDAGDYLAEARRMRLGGGGKRHVTREDALRHSAVWACLRLRADLISTMPIDVFRRVGGVQVEVPKPPVLINPGGEKVEILEWMYSTQSDLDSCGNTFGLIAARDALGLPARIDLVPFGEVTVRVRKGIVSYQIAEKTYDAREVWHEKQFTTSGLPVGLSPIAHAAMTINGYLSAQQFAADWFGNSAVPAASLKNTEKTIDRNQAAIIKNRFKESIAAGDVFVHGKDWDYNMLAAKASESGFIDEREFSVGDVCRFFGVPGDMIDANASGTSVTYANITQRNLQLLIMHIGPALVRREGALGKLLPKPRYVKINRNAILEMDLKSRYESYGVAITNRFLVPSEIRELENRPPFTPEQEAEFVRLFPSKVLQPQPGGTP